jgi:hypothetical protein
MESSDGVVNVVRDGRPRVVRLGIPVGAKGSLLLNVNSGSGVVTDS